MTPYTADTKAAFLVTTFYRFVHVDEPSALRGRLLPLCQRHSIRGTILIAEEGINGTVSGSPAAIEQLQAYFESDERFRDLNYKYSEHDKQPFLRMKVKLKREIVTLGVPGVDPAERNGTYVDPKTWDELLADPDVVVIDTRNEYEVNLGSFRGAINPHTETFREFPEYVSRELNPNKNKRVAMFCTGGIRCEKASAYMLEQGFEEVYHLQGGILRYLEDTPAEKSQWQGECFVFDDRVTVDHELQGSERPICPGCRRPVEDEHLHSPDYEPGLCCPRCAHRLTSEKRAAVAERRKQQALARERGESHRGQDLNAAKARKQAERKAKQDQQPQ